MTTKHRKRHQAAKRIATMGAATATAAVLSATLVSPTTTAQPVNPLFKAQRAEAVSLAAAYNGYGTELDPIFPPPADIPDLTNGLGTQIYNALQNAGDPAVRQLVDALSFPSIGEALGLTQDGVNAALGALIIQALTGIPIDLGSLTGGLSPALAAILGPVLNLLPIDNVAELLALLGFDFSNPLGDLPGLNIVTAGAPFALLKMIGVDLGWNPAFPNSVANDVNATQYLDVGLGGLLDAIKILPDAPLLLPGAVDTLEATLKLLFGEDVLEENLIALRVPIVVGFGLGAFAAGAAYPQVVSQLPAQPGGSEYTGTEPLLGSITIMPMMLLRNPGRANGGLFARAYPLFRLLGIDTVTRETEVTNDNGTEIGQTGLYLGGATLIPIKIDATVEYDWLSDFPAWPNPFSLANSVAAGLFPTYILRGLDTTNILASVTAQLGPQLAPIIASLTNDDPLALNLYLTIPVEDALPLLEPIKLAVDFVNLFSPVKFNNPIATALEPALTSLVNLGYTDAVLMPDANGVPGYGRTLLEAGTPTAFGTLPAGIDWGQVPAIVFKEFVVGVQKAIDDGLIDTTPGPNVLQDLLDLIGVGSLTPGGLAPLSQSLAGGGAGTANPFGNLTDIISQATGGSGLPGVGGGSSQAKIVQQGSDAKPLAIVESVKQERTEAGKLLTKSGLQDAADKARDQADQTLKKARGQLNEIAEKGRKDVERVVSGAQERAMTTAAKVKHGDGPVRKAMKKTQDKS